MELSATTFAFVPGLLSDQIVWEPLAEQLSENAFHADLTAQSSIPEMADSVLASTQGNLIVAGHSMGGRVAMEIAYQAPERVKALILSNTGHDALRSGEAEKRQAKIDHGHKDFAGMAAEWLLPMVAPDRTSDDRLMASLTSMVMRQSPEIHERQIRALMDRPNAGDYLPRFNCPILLMTGALDSWAPEPQHREMAKMAKQAELHVVAGAGHFLPLEKPKEVIGIVRSWLSRVKESIGA